jgi:cell wall-associated NlpC family hydrolase
MIPYYQSPDRQSAFLTEARRWIGTPFRAGSAICGEHGGVDCVGLVAAIHSACGACSLSELPRRPLDWHLHNDASAILEFFRMPEVRARLAGIEEGRSRLNGDLVAVQTGLCVHHLGLWISDGIGAHLLHVPVGSRVQRWSMDDPMLRGRIAGIWRILEATA